MVGVRFFWKTCGAGYKGLSRIIGLVSVSALFGREKEKLLDFFSVLFCVVSFFFSVRCSFWVFRVVFRFVDFV